MRRQRSIVTADFAKTQHIERDDHFMLETYSDLEVGQSPLVDPVLLFGQSHYFIDKYNMTTTAIVVNNSGSASKKPGE